MLVGVLAQQPVRVPDRSGPYASLEIASLHLLFPRGGLMTAAMVRSPHDGAGSLATGRVATAGDLEVPRPLRLLLTAGWSLTESAGLPVAAYALAARADGRNAARSRRWRPSG